jgi:predicted Fe-Mo cluster-binding NifX family protein
MVAVIVAWRLQFLLKQKEANRGMKMALTVWGSRISPVFDAAHMLLVVEIENTKIINRWDVPFYPEFPSRLAEMLAEMDVEIFICGAISEMPSNILESNGIKLIPFIAGDTHEVIDAYVKNVPFIPTFLMPGCNRKRYRYTGKGKKHGACFSHGREVTHMPRGDGTGPKGKGSGTGRGQGGCKPGQGRKGSGTNSGPGSGKGQGRGRGRGKGTGQGRNRSEA